MPSYKSIFKSKPISLSMKEADSSGKKALSRTMGAMDLTALGIGAIIGTGVFVLTGIASAYFAGPAVIISFVLAGIAATLAALCYAELASSIPVAGGAYTYTYSTMGEIMGWLVGWTLILAYLVSGAAVAVGWSGYLSDMLRSMGLSVPGSITLSPGEGGVINLPAILIIMLVTALAIRGTKNSAKATQYIVLIKLTVLVMFVLVGIFKVNPVNWVPFTPFGVSGIMAGAAIVFFAYIGFDAVATAAEEVKNPKRDLPIGIIGSVAISTVLYILVAAVLTGMLTYSSLGTPSPMSTAMLAVGIRWASAFISVGAIAGLTSVLIVLVYAQSRVFFAMSRDGLLPPFFAILHERFQTPYINTLIIGGMMALIAALFPIGIIAALANIGTLLALSLVSLGLIILRRTHPDLERPFRVPWVPYLPGLAIVACVYLMINLPPVTWGKLIVWLWMGVMVYFSYGFKHSVLRNDEVQRDEIVLDNLVSPRAMKENEKKKPFRFRLGRV